MKLCIEGLSKSFGAHEALRNLTLTLTRSGITLLLGHNGSGKSTLLAIAANLLQPTAGRLSFTPKHERVGYLGHKIQLYGALTAIENINLFAACGGLPASHAREALERWDLLSVKDTRVEHLSRGQQQRIALARSFLGSPAWVLLDEPTSCLDDSTTELFIRELRHHGDSGIIIATHDLGRLQDVANRAIVLREGRLERDSDASSLQEVYTSYRSSNR